MVTYKRSRSAWVDDQLMAIGTKQRQLDQLVNQEFSDKDIR